LGEAYVGDEKILLGDGNSVEKPIDRHEGRNPVCGLF